MCMQYIFVFLINAFENATCKMLSIQLRPHCVVGLSHGIYFKFKFKNYIVMTQARRDMTIVMKIVPLKTIICSETALKIYWNYCQHVTIIYNIPTFRAHPVSLFPGVVFILIIFPSCIFCMIHFHICISTC